MINHGLVCRRIVIQEAFGSPAKSMIPTSENRFPDKIVRPQKDPAASLDA
jgi:hypothetical protein